MNRFLIFLLFSSIVFFSTSLMARTHTYNFSVINKRGEPLRNIKISTDELTGYAQNFGSCITDENGKCSITFSNFIIKDNRVSVVLKGDDSEVPELKKQLPSIKNSLLKNNDNLDLVLDYYDLYDINFLKLKAAQEEEQRIKYKNLEIKSFYTCTLKKECGRIFALTEIFIVEHSDMKIQTKTDNIIETFNPTDIFKVGLQALKIQNKSNGAVIKVKVICRPVEYEVELNLSNRLCNIKKYEIYQSYINQININSN